MNYFNICFIIGIIIIVIGIISIIIHKKKRERYTLSIEAEVVDITIKDGPDSSIFDVAIYKYINNEGKEVVVRATTGTNRCKHNIGDKVILLFNENDMSDFIDPSIKFDTIFDITFILFGVVFIVMSICGYS